MEDNKKGITVISPDKIGVLMVHITDEGDQLIKHIKEVTKTLLMMKKSIDRYEFSNIDMNGLIYMMDSQFYVPDEGSFCLDAIKLHHNTPITSHPRTEKILEMLQYSYSRPKITNYVKDYVSCYDRCQYFKVGNIVPASKL